MSKSILIIILIVIILIVAWMGLSIYSCYDRQAISGTDIPDRSKAAYSVYIENTGNVIYTDDYEVHGSGIGNRVFTLAGFWEINKDKYIYKDARIILDEVIFGEITIKRR